jgi:hypothetical protein
LQKIIKEVFRKPVGPVVGFASQFIFMPLVTTYYVIMLTVGRVTRLGEFRLFISFGRYLKIT